MRIGASGMCFWASMDDARHSTSATIADRRSRAAIVVPRSLRREPRPDGGPQPFQPRSSSPRFLASCSLSFSSSTAAPPRWLQPCWRSAGGSRRSRSIISCPYILTPPPGVSCFRRRTARAASALFGCAGSANPSAHCCPLRASAATSSARGLFTSAAFRRASHRQHGGRYYGRLRDAACLCARRRGAAHRR